MKTPIQKHASGLHFFGIKMSEPKKGRHGQYAALPTELADALDHFSKVQFPIDSKSDFVRKMGANATIPIGKDKVPTEEMMMYLPAEVSPHMSPKTSRNTGCSRTS